MKRILKTTWWAAMVAVGLSWGSSAMADTNLFFDTFETQPLNATINTITPPIGEKYTTTGASDVKNQTTVPPGGAPNQFVRYYSGGSIDRWFVTPASEALAVGKTVTFKWDLYVKNVTGGGNNLNFLTHDTSGTSATEGFDFLVREDGSMAAYYGGTGHGLAGNAANLFRRDQWVPVTVVANFSAQTYTATVDTYTFTAPFGGAGTTFRDVYVGNSGLAAFYDNILISIPEPSTLALVGFALAGVPWLRRRRK